MDRFYYLIFGVFFIFFLLNGKYFKIDRLFIILLIFSISYLIFYPLVRYSITSILKYFTYPMCYLLGLNFINKSKLEYSPTSYKEKHILAGLVALSIGAFLHYVLNMINNIGNSNRNTIDFWTNNVLSATNQAGLAVMATGVFIALAFSSESKKIKIISIAGLVIIFSYNLVLAGRTLLLLIGINFFVALYYTIRNVNLKEKIHFISMVVFFGVAILVIYSLNIFNVRNIILGSNLLSRFDSTTMFKDGRFQRKILYLINMPYFPFGGGGLRDYVGGYSHDLFLDCYNDVGILGLIPLLIFTICTFLNAFKIILRNKIGKQCSLVILCLFLSLFLEFLIEPIIQGIPWMFCAFCFFSGLIRNLEHN